MFKVMMTLILFPNFLFALVDMQNANYAETWTDIKMSGVGFNLTVDRTYNSRTLYSGMFGYGWCSTFETSLEITSDNSIKIVECGSGDETVYTTKKGLDVKTVKKNINKIIAKFRAESKPSAREIKALTGKLYSSKYLRSELAKKYGIKGKINSKAVYLSNGKGPEKIIFKNGNYDRSLVDGTKQRYNLKGQLAYLYDKNANFLKLQYRKGLLVKITDNNSRQLSFSYNQTKKVAGIQGSRGLKAKYKYQGEDLVWSSNFDKEKFTYSYDSGHNLTKIVYPDKRIKKLEYNAKRDWVIGFTNLKGCKESYKYKFDPKQKQKHYWSTVVKKCKGKVVNKSEFEFIFSTNKNGVGNYLKQVKSSVNGLKSEVKYHSTFDKPILIVRDGRSTAFDYYKNGFIKSKKDKYRHLGYAYNSCGKVSKLVTKVFGFKPYKDKKSKKTRSKFKKLNTISSNYKYDKKCNLKFAKNSIGQEVKLSYDSRGRIKKIIDQANKTVFISYDKVFGKPRMIKRPGLGTIKVSYDKEGKINKVDSKEGPIVASQVASVFNNLLEIISPATADLTL